VERALAAALGQRVVVTGRAPVGGGSISHVDCLETSAGPFVLKWLPDAPAGFFEAEAAGLDALRAAGSGFAIPQVIALADPRAVPTSPPFLVIEFLPRGRPTVDDGVHERMGRALAVLHQSTAAQFGFDRDTFCGTTRQPNGWTASWVAFYASARLGHQVQLARDAGHLSAADCRLADALLARLDTRLTEPAEGPALIHGDLWTGNLHVTADGAAALLDPAVCYAHREAELGIMTLFGGFPRRVFDSYQEAFPLDVDWRERHPLYQLYHLLNHLHLFGASYHAPVVAILRRFR
jgi:protein-ribulosamine 3-kinase